MAVPASKRKVSGMQYVDTALQMASNMLTFANGMSAKLQRLLGDPLFRETLELVKHVSCANRIYVKDQATFELRRSHLMDALGELDTISALLDIYWVHYVRTHQPPKDEEEAMKYEVALQRHERRYLGFAEDIESERKLIHGVLSRDRTAREKQAAG